MLFLGEVEGCDFGVMGVGDVAFGDSDGFSGFIEDEENGREVFVNAEIGLFDGIHGCVLLDFGLKQCRLFSFYPFYLNLFGFAIDSLSFFGGSYEFTFTGRHGVRVRRGLAGGPFRGFV